MLNWLCNRIVNRRRKIFTYWDGCKNVSVDPLLVWRSILSHTLFDPETLGPAYDRGEEDAWKLVQKITRDVFNVPAFTILGQPGLTELELDSLFKRFQLYMEGLKKSTSQSPTSQPPMVEIPSSSYTVPTNVLSALHLTPNANASDSLGP